MKTNKKEIDYEKKYKEALERAREFQKSKDGLCVLTAESIFPELKESDGRIIREITEFLVDFNNGEYEKPNEDTIDSWIAWLEKQGEKTNWCHHKVDLSNCSEEYRKAYYDGWNNCNMQHSQEKSESNDVVKCLINGMKFYYEDNKEATWGTEKFSMKVKDIIAWLEKQKSVSEIVERCKNSWYNEGKIAGMTEGLTDDEKYQQGWHDALEKQGKKNPTWSEGDETLLYEIVDYFNMDDALRHTENEIIDWLKSLKERLS